MPSHSRRTHSASHTRRARSASARLGAHANARKRAFEEKRKRNEKAYAEARYGPAAPKAHGGGKTRKGRRGASRRAASRKAGPAKGFAIVQRRFYVLQ